MASRESRRRAIQLAKELQVKHPERTIYPKEYGDRLSGGWTTSWWICAKPFQKPRWYHRFMWRRHVPMRIVE